MQKLRDNENIFKSRNCLSKDELIGYARGTLNEKAKHMVEKHLLDCELCTEALEGVMQLKDPAWLANISDDMIRKMSEKNAVVKKSRSTLYLIAAVFSAVVLISGLYFQFIRNAEKLKPDYAVLASKQQPKNLTENAASISTDSSVSLPVASIEKAESGNTETSVSREAKALPSATLSFENPAVNQTDKLSAVETMPSQAITDEKKDMDMEITREPAAEITNEEQSNKEIATAGSTVADQSPVSSTITSQSVKSNSLSKQKLAKYENADTGNRHKIEADQYQNVRLNIERENYSDALSELNKMLKENPADANSLYNTGIVYYKMEKNSKALQYFDKTINNADKKYYEDARWYKVLTFVKMNDKSNALKIINNIIAEKSVYKDRAENLLEEIGK